jgi:lipoyl synthase
MKSWLGLVERIEPLEGIRLESTLVGDMESRFEHLHGAHVGPIHLYTPSFKSYSTSEIAACGKSAWPAVSITGGDCKLQCDHCKARILEPMIEARTPDTLWSVVNEQIAEGAQGMLLTGGSNYRNEVEYDAFYPTIRRIKDAYPDFRIAVHTAIVNQAGARRMEESGIDVAMTDVIGAQDTVAQVYHLRRSVGDFERTLEALAATSLKVVPHIVIGLHYGRMLGEWNALEMLTRHKPDAVVLVVVMPFYAPENRPFAVPASEEVGAFFMDAREALPDIPLLLGCARPAGRPKSEIDAYAVMAGLNGLAHPSDGIVELAARLGRRVRVTPSCCSIAVGDEVLALDNTDSGLQIDVEQIIAQERQRHRPAGGLSSIKVVAAGSAGG